MVTVKTPEVEIQERDEFMNLMYAKLRQPGMTAPHNFAKLDFTNRATRLRERLDELIEDERALQEAFTNFDQVRTDYTRLIVAFNKLIEIMNRFDGENREPITPESWREVCQKEDERLAQSTPRIGRG